MQVVNVLQSSLSGFPQDSHFWSAGSGGQQRCAESLLVLVVHSWDHPNFSSQIHRTHADDEAFASQL